MNIDNIKTISFEEIEEFLKNLKSGDVYNAVSRKAEKAKELPYVLNYFQKQWFKTKENSVVLVLNDTIFPMPDKISTLTLPPVIRVKSHEQWDKCSNSFLKVLYKEQICLVHAGWLEKI